jgi:cytochrome b561
MGWEVFGCSSFAKASKDRWVKIKVKLLHFGFYILNFETLPNCIGGFETLQENNKSFAVG